MRRSPARWRPLIAVPAPFDGQSQIVLAGEVDGGDHISGVLGCDGIGAPRRRPSIHPAESLRQARLVAQEIRIFELTKQLPAILT